MKAAVGLIGVLILGVYLYHRVHFLGHALAEKQAAFPVAVVLPLLVSHS
jgi:hypothetical protein